MADDLLSYYQAPDEASAQKQAAIIAEAIRKKRENAAQQQAMGAILGLSGTDNGAGRLGQSFSKAGAQDEADADQTATQLAAAPQHRLAMAMNQLKQKQAQAQYNDEESLAGPGYQQLATQLRTELTPGATVRQAKEQLAVAEKQRALELGKFGSSPLGLFNTRTGQITTPAPGAGDATGGLKPKDIKDEFEKLKQAVSTVQGRGNLNKENQQRLNNAERLEALVLGPGGQIQNLTPQQVREAGTALANLISSGNMSLQQIEELTPVSMASKFASFKQKWTNEPQGADAQAFLQNMMETAAREKKVVMKQIRAGQTQGIPNYAHLAKIDANRYRSILSGAGLNPDELDENGLPKPEQSAGGPSGGQIKVSNGKETLLIDPADEAEAAKDGYRRL